MSTYIQNLKREIANQTPEQLDAYTADAMSSDRAAEALQRDIERAEEGERWDLCG